MADAERFIELFHQALAEPAGPARERWLARNCGDDLDLKAQVLSLLQSQEGVGEFLKNTVFSATALKGQELGDVIGRYKLLEKIGEGGCGVVFSAEQSEPVRRRVALKVVKLGMDTEQVVARFQAERQALAMMDHPNIAKVLDAGSTESGRPYFVMELVRGIRITEYCDQNQLSTTERLHLFVKVCQAIQHAHQKGVIHRDIKPSNILVTLHDGVPVPKVIDFGIAKAIEGRLTDATVYTQLLHFIGTPAYMSPEQVELSGLDIDTRSDIYSLGVLLYELLTGKTPFDGQKLVASGLDLMRKTIRQTDPLRPSTQLTQELVSADNSNPSDGLRIRPEAEARAQSRRHRRLKEQIKRVRGDLDWIVMKCLEKDRSRRYDTANGLTADLQRHLANEPVMARPPSAAYKLEKAWRRNKFTFSALAAVATALIAGITLSSWWALEAQTEGSNARKAQRSAEQARLSEEQAHREAEKEKVAAQHDRYVAKMQLAGQVWQQGNFDQLRRALRDTRTFPSRGFEWAFWQRQAHLHLTALRGHSGNVRSASFSPDGDRIITASEDMTARVWNPKTGRELVRLVGHTAGLTSAAFSSSGKRILTGSWDGTARLWDAMSGRELLPPIIVGVGINAVAFSPDGQRFVTGDRDGSARMWDVATRRELFPAMRHEGPVHSVAFARDGRWIVTGSQDHATLWEAETGHKTNTFAPPSGPVLSVAFSSDGKWVATGSCGPEETIVIWNAVTGQKKLSLNSVGPISSLAFSLDDRRIVAGSFMSTATVWDTTTPTKLQTIRGHRLGVLTVAFSPVSQQIVTAGDAVAKVWDASGLWQRPPFEGSSNSILAVAIAPDGRRIATGGASSADSLETGGKQAAQLWESDTGAKQFDLSGHDAGISSLAFSRDGQWIVTGSGDQTARVWEVATGREVRKLEGHGGPVLSVVFSPDGKQVVTGYESCLATVWEVETGRRLLELTGHSNAVTCVVYSKDAKRIVTGSLDRTVRVWDAATGSHLRTIPTSLQRVIAVDLSPDGRWVVAGGWNRMAIVFEVETGRERCKLVAHLGPISSVAFSPDAQRIVTASLDGTARLWEAATGEELLTLYGHQGGVNSVAFSSDGLRIITGGSDKTVKVWDAASASELASWEREDRSEEESEASSLKAIDTQSGALMK